MFHIPMLKTPYFIMQAEDIPLPLYNDIKDLLPKPIWDGHDDAIVCYEISLANRLLKFKKTEC